VRGLEFADGVAVNETDDAAVVEEYGLDQGATRSLPPPNKGAWEHGNIRTCVVRC
jgi:hypothetical protein